MENTENNYLRNKKQVKWNNEFIFYFIENLREENNSFHIKEEHTKDNNRKGHVNIDDEKKTLIR